MGNGGPSVAGLQVPLALKTLREPMGKVPGDRFRLRPNYLINLD